MKVDRRVVLWLVVIFIACVHRSPNDWSIESLLDEPPPAGPRCYQGTWLLAATPIGGQGDPVHSWLVLDSRDEALAPGYRAAYFMWRNRRETPSPARWRPIGDSIEVEVTSAFPPAKWTFADRDTVLVGRLRVLHDFMSRDASGHLIAKPDERPARAVRTPCRDAP